MAAMPRKVPMLSPHAMSNRFRRQRFGRFLGLVHKVLAASDRVSILDIGGDAGYWRAFEPLWRGLPIDLTIINLYQPDARDAAFNYQQGDARNLHRIPDGAFDIVHSNSVIEHVGEWPDMEAFAREVRRVGRHHFVQTPNFWFPIEPHVRLPGFQFLPAAIRCRILMSGSWGFIPRARDIDSARHEIRHMQLLDARGLGRLFPQSAIERETFFGLTKSLMAIGSSSTLRGPAAGEPRPES
jgi:hypothetical protein